MVRGVEKKAIRKLRIDENKISFNIFFASFAFPFRVFRVYKNSRIILIWVNKIKKAKTTVVIIKAQDKFFSVPKRKWARTRLRIKTMVVKKGRSQRVVLFANWAIPHDWE